MKRFLSLLVLVVMLCTSIGIANAATIDSPSSGRITEQETFLHSFLSDLANDAKSDAFSKVTDERFALGSEVDVNSLNVTERAYADSVARGDKFAEMYAKDPIKSFDIVYGSGITENNVTVVNAKLFFESGAVAIVPFKIASSGSGFKILFTLDDIEADGYDVIQESPDVISTEAAPEAKTKNNGTRYSGSQWKDDYTFSYLFGTIYGIDTFSISKYVGNFDGYQANDALDTGWQSEAEVVYAVCKSHWYGDDVWGSTGNAVKMNGYFNVYFQGKNNDFSDCTIRISNQTGAYPRSAGEGSFYQCDN